MSGSNQDVARQDQQRFGRKAILQFSIVITMAFAVSTAATAAESTQTDAQESKTTSVFDERLEADRLLDSTTSPMLIGLAARDLLGEIPPPALPTPRNQTPFEFPNAIPAAPVAVPFPTAVHLFVPGALMAIYAGRRFRRR